MRKCFPLFLAILLLSPGCNPNKKKAYDFNQKLVEISDTLNKKGTRIGTEVALAVNTRDFSRVDIINRELLDFIDIKTAELKKTPNTAGSEKLKAAMLDFLAFEKEMISSYFLPLGKMNTQTPDTTIQAAVDRMVDKSKDESSYLARVQKAQKDFAKSNGFVVEDKN